MITLQKATHAQRPAFDLPTQWGDASRCRITASPCAKISLTVGTRGVRRRTLKGCITSLRNDGIGRHVFESGEVPTIVHSASGDINSNGVPVPFAHRSKLIRTSVLLLSCTVGFSGISNTVVSGFSYLLCVSQGAKSIIQMLYRPLFQLISRSIFADCPLGMG